MWKANRNHVVAMRAPVLSHSNLAISFLWVPDIMYIFTHQFILLLLKARKEKPKG